MKNPENLSCSFCGKPQRNAKKIIASPNGECFICDECVAICREIIREDEAQTQLEKIDLPIPSDIKSKLDEIASISSFITVKIFSTLSRCQISS